MESGTTRKQLDIGGMTCAGCQNTIEKKLRKTAGVKSVKANWRTGVADIVYDADTVSLKDISVVIDELGYQVLAGSKRRKPPIVRVAVVSVVIVLLYAALQQFGILNQLVPSQLAENGIGYGMLFVVGLLTSLHCIAMCGGINLSQSLPRESREGILPERQGKLSALVPALLYNFGRVASYTVIGFILGFVGLLLGGGADAGLPVIAQGILKIVAGLVMVLMGINMLGLFPALRKLQPHMPKALARKAEAGKARSASPLVVGLLNGFMPCGPLQSMQLVALASGNPFVGGLSMLLFSLGTVPLVLGLGSVVSALGKKFTQTVMTVGAVLVVALGLAMLSQGGSISGFLTPDLLLVIVLALCVTGIVYNVPFRKPTRKAFSTVGALCVMLAAVVAWNVLTDGEIFTGSRSSADSGSIAVIEGKQVITSTLSRGRYPHITVEAGTPVKWVINAPNGSINGCNNRMSIQEYSIIDYSLKPGENIIEFTPDKTGRFQYSCWMGMIHGSITVVDA